MVYSEGESQPWRNMDRPPSTPGGAATVKVMLLLAVVAPWLSFPSWSVQSAAVNSWQQKTHDNVAALPVWRMDYGQFVTDQFLCNGTVTPTTSPSVAPKALFMYGGWGGAGVSHNLTMTKAAEYIFTDLWCFDLEDHTWSPFAMEGAPGPSHMFPPSGGIVLPRRVDLLPWVRGEVLTLLPFVAFEDGPGTSREAVGLCEYSSPLASCGLMKLQLPPPRSNRKHSGRAKWLPFGVDSRGLTADWVDAVTIDQQRSEVLLVGRERGGVSDALEFKVWACSAVDGVWSRVETGEPWKTGTEWEVFGAFLYEKNLYVMAVTAGQSVASNITVTTLSREEGLTPAKDSKSLEFIPLVHAPNIYPSPHGYYHRPMVVGVAYNRLYLSYKVGESSGPLMGGAEPGENGTVEVSEILPDGEVLVVEGAEGGEPGNVGFRGEVPMTVSFVIPSTPDGEWENKEEQVLIDQRTRDHDHSRVVLQETMYTTELRGGSWAVGLLLLSWYNYWDGTTTPKGIRPGVYGPLNAYVENNIPNGVNVEIAQSPDVIGCTERCLRRTIRYVGLSTSLPVMFGHASAMDGPYIYVHGGVPRPRHDVQWAALGVPDRAYVPQLHGLYRYHIKRHEWSPIVIDMMSGVCKSHFLAAHGRTFHTLTNSQRRLALLGGFAMQTQERTEYINTDCGYDVGSGVRLAFCEKIRVFDTALNLWLLYELSNENDMDSRMNPARYGHTALGLAGGDVVVFGGVPADYAVTSRGGNAVIRYSFNHQEKTARATILHPGTDGPPLPDSGVPRPRYFHAAAGHAQSPYMYVHGGCTKFPRSGSSAPWYGCEVSSSELFRFHLTSCKWELVRPLGSSGGESEPGARSGHALVAIGPSMLVLGGGLRVEGTASSSGYGDIELQTPDEHKLMSDIFMFSAEQNLWAAHPISGNTPAPRQFHTMMSIGSSKLINEYKSATHPLVMMGGYTPEFRIDVYKETPWEVSLACMAGSESTDLGIFPCGQCPVGKFSMGFGDMCSSCPEGLTTPEPGATSVTACQLCVPDYCNGRGTCSVIKGVSASAQCVCNVFSHGPRCSSFSPLAWALVGSTIFVVLALLSVVMGFLVYGWLRTRSTLYALTKDRRRGNGDGACSVDLHNSEELADFLIDPKKVYIEARIATGASAVIHRGRWNSHRVAVKEFVDMTDPNQVVSEALIMKRLHHPNILRMWGACILPGGPVVVLEHADRGSLTQALAGGLSHSRTRVIRVALDVARAMLHLHTREPPVLHRDLKPDNILIFDDDTAKVADFGISRAAAAQAAAGMMTTNIGTIRYMSPEVINNGEDGQRRAYATSADVFSYGMTMYTVLTHGRIPFDDLVWGSQVAAALLRGERPPIGGPAATRGSEAKDALLNPINRHDEALWSIVTECWRQEPSERPTFMEIVERLERLL